MKILHVHDFFAPGNSRYGFDMDRMLVERGHELHVLAGRGELGPDDGAVLEGITFHTYPYAFEMGGLGKYRYALRKNAEIFTPLQEKEKFDVLLFNQPLCAAGVLRSPAARGVPRTYSFISPWAEEWRVSNPGAGLLSRLLNYLPRRRMERKALHRCQSVMVESEFIRSELHRLHPDVEKEKVRLVPGAVDLERFVQPVDRNACREKWGLPADRPVLMTMRRLVPRMGIDNLIRAMNDLPDVLLLVGGDGPIRQELENLAGEIGVADRVRFLGYVRDADLNDLYAAADLFVLPTLALEGFGLVLIEAMACGTPAAGTPVGAIPEVLPDLDPGLLLPGITPEALSSGIGALIGDPGRLSRLREACRDYVAARYDWRKVAVGLEAALEAARK